MCLPPRHPRLRWWPSLRRPSRRRRRRPSWSSRRKEARPRQVKTIEEIVVAAATETDTASAPMAEEPKKEELIWGVPLAGGDERTDVVLLKFLRAHELKVKEAMAMLKAAVMWRKSFGIDALLAADLGVPELEGVVFYRGADREGFFVDG